MFESLIVNCCLAHKIVYKYKAPQLVENCLIWDFTLMRKLKPNPKSNWISALTKLKNGLKSDKTGIKSLTCILITKDVEGKGFKTQKFQVEFIEIQIEISKFYNNESPALKTGEVQTSTDASINWKLNKGLSRFKE